MEFYLVLIGVLVVIDNVDVVLRVFDSFFVKLLVGV